MPRKSPNETTIPDIISNVGNVYEGNLEEYFRIFFYKGQNHNKPYHNFRHPLHMLWLCNQACIYYEDTISRLDMRILHIAHLFHDINHAGMLGNDDLNIKRSVRFCTQHVLPEDVKALTKILKLIRVTEYPHKVPSEKLTLLGKIIRDTDLAQAFSPAWLQQVVFGLAAEWQETPLKVLKAQPTFLGSHRFVTKWAQTLFPQSVIDAKIKEAQDLIAILEPTSSVKV